MYEKSSKSFLNKSFLLLNTSPKFKLTQNFPFFITPILDNTRPQTGFYMFDNKSAKNTEPAGHETHLSKLT